MYFKASWELPLHTSPTTEYPPLCLTAHRRVVHSQYFSWTWTSFKGQNNCTFCINNCRLFQERPVCCQREIKNLDEVKTIPQNTSSLMMATSKKKKNWCRWSLKWGQTARQYVSQEGSSRQIKGDFKHKKTKTTPNNMDPKDKNGNKTYPQQFFRQLKLKFDVCKLQKHACEQCPFSACLAVCILRLACAAQVSYVISKCFPALHIGKDRIKMTASWGVQTPSKKTSPVAQILIKGWIMGR